MTPTQPNKPDDTQWNIARIVAGHDNNYGQIPEVGILIASLELFERSRLAPLLAQNAVLQGEVAQARKVIEGCNVWIAEAKPLLECGGEAECENKSLKAELVQLKALQENDAECASRLEREVAALQAQVEAANEYPQLVKQYHAVHERLLDSDRKLACELGRVALRNQVITRLQAQVEAAKGAAYALKQAQDYLTGNSDSNPHALVEDTLTRCTAAGLTAREGM